MKILLSIIIALSVLAGVAGSAGAADDPSCQGFMRDGLTCWPSDQGK